MTGKGIYWVDINLSSNIRSHFEEFTKKTIEAVTLMQSAFGEYAREINSKSLDFIQKIFGRK